MLPLKQLSNNITLPQEEIFNSICIDMQKVGDVSLGSDVEVLWVSKSDTLESFNFFAADRIFAKNGIYGTDGRTLQGEWRLSPAYDVNVLKNVTMEMLTYCKAFTQLTLRNSKGVSIHPYGMAVYPLFELRDIQIPESIGLHIHFGHPRLLSNSEHSKTLVAALDMFLTPAVKYLEPVVGNYIRTQCSYYGDLSDYEEKPYGMEYKTLPSCIDDPDIFMGTFAIAKALAFEVISGNINRKMLSEFCIEKDRLTDKHYLKVLAKLSQIFVKRFCRFYYVYKDLIDTFYAKVLIGGVNNPFEIHEDIFTRWGIDCSAVLEDPSTCSLLLTRVLMPTTNPIGGYLNNVIPGSANNTSTKYHIVRS